MLDPIFIPVTLYQIAKPFGEYSHLRTLPLHIHEALIGFIFFLTLDSLVAPNVSKKIIPNRYRDFSKKSKISWDIHVTSMVHALLVTSLIFWVMAHDEKRDVDDWEGRIWGYTGAAGMVQGLTTGYWLWDIKVCLLNLKTMGAAYLVHGLSAGFASLLGFRPCAIYYGMRYMLFEISTPFANFHWFLNKTGMSGSLPQFYNGILFMISFFGCRLVWGSYLTYALLTDLWQALHTQTFTPTTIPHTPDHVPLILDNYLPWWLAGVFLSANVALMTLNFFWFSKMIITMTSHLKTRSAKQEALSTGKVAAMPTSGAAAAREGNGDARQRNTTRYDKS